MSGRANASGPRVERDANYAAVGAFVLVAALLGALFVYWYSDARDQRSFNRYEVYFDGSVSGLAVGGQVRYLGVDVGRVVRIKLDQRAADRVQVIVDIDSSALLSGRAAGSRNTARTPTIPALPLMGNVTAL